MFATRYGSPSLSSSSSSSLLSSSLFSSSSSVFRSRYGDPECPSIITGGGDALGDRRGGSLYNRSRYRYRKINRKTSYLANAIRLRDLYPA